MKHCDFYFFETLRNVFEKYSGRCFYQTLQNVSNIKKFQCLTKTSNSSISKKDLAIFRGKTMLYIPDLLTNHIWLIIFDVLNFSLSNCMKTFIIKFATRGVKLIEH